MAKKEEEIAGLVDQLSYRFLTSNWTIPTMGVASLAFVAAVYYTDAFDKSLLTELKQDFQQVSCFLYGDDCSRPQNLSSQALDLK